MRQNAREREVKIILQIIKNRCKDIQRPKRLLEMREKRSC
jgi:hypothetical protein